MNVLRHLACTVRALGRAKAYSVAVIATIALGVMAGAVVFTLYKGALLDPWPYEGGDRLLVFRGDYPALGRDEYPLLSAQDYQDLRELEGIFDHVVAGRGRDVGLLDEGGATLVRGAELTPNAFAMLGIEPLHGRLPGEADAAPQAWPTALISHGLWQRRYGGDPAALGSTLRIDGLQRTIVGIMPPRFLWWGSEIWLPLRVEPAIRAERSYVVQARLASGVDLQEDNAALHRHPQADRGSRSASGSHRRRNRPLGRSPGPAARGRIARRAASPFAAVAVCRGRATDRRSAGGVHRSGGCRGANRPFCCAARRINRRG